MSKIFKWDGNKWIKPDIFRWNGSKWAKADVFRWGSKGFEKITEQRHQKTFDCTWSQSYGGNGQQKPQWLGSRDVMHQGRYGEPYTADWDWGIQKSMMGFDDTSIRKELEGAEIEKVELYLRNKHFWYYAGGYATIGYHNSSGRPSTFQSIKNQVHRLYFNGRGAAKWIDLGVNFGKDLRDNKVKGLVLYAPTTILDHYGYFYGQGGGAYKPKLRITYKK